MSRGEQSRTSCVVSKAGHFKLQHQIYHAQLEERLHRLRSAALFRKSPARDHAVRFAQAGERRRRVCELQLAAPSVATRNGLALPARIGVSRIPRQKIICPASLSPKMSCFENYATPSAVHLDTPPGSATLAFRSARTEDLLRRSNGVLFRCRRCHPHPCRHSWNWLQPPALDGNCPLRIAAHTV